MEISARIISFITNPLFVLFPIPYLLVYRFGYDHLYAIKWALFSFLFTCITGVFVLYEVRHKVFSDMDVSKREQRPLLFGFVGVVTALYFISLFVFNAPPILFITVWGIMVGIVLATLINYRVKASLHVGTITAVTITLVKLYDLPYVIFLLIPLVAWARIKIKRHTKQEVLVGMLFGIGLTTAMYILLKYIYGLSL